MKDKKIKIAYVLIYLLVFTSCVSNKAYSNSLKGDNNLRIIILDEKGASLSNVNVEIIESTSGQKYSAVTNDSGLITINNVPFGLYHVSSQKVNFTSLNNMEINFTNEKEIFICTILSAEYVFDKTLELYKQKKYAQGVNLLEKLKLDTNSSYFVTACLYKAEGYGIIGESDKSFEYMNKIMEVEPKLLLEILESGDY